MLASVPLHFFSRVTILAVPSTTVLLQSNTTTTATAPYCYSTNHSHITNSFVYQSLADRLTKALTCTMAEATIKIQSKQEFDTLLKSSRIVVADCKNPLSRPAISCNLCFLDVFAYNR